MSFPEREKYLGIILNQLSSNQLAPASLGIKELWMDYRKIYIPEVYQRNSIPVIPLTGWGSGWEGIAPLAFSLACEGKEVFLISLPGYGDSFDPPPCFFEEDYFENAAEVLIAFLTWLRIGKVILVGHSMGGQIAARAARIRPDLVEKLLLVSPSGVRKYDTFGERIGLAWNFKQADRQLWRWYREELKKNGGKHYLQPLIDMCNQQRSPFGWGRLRQRFYEWRAISRGGLLEDLKKVQCPVSFFGGAEDTVFPASSDMWEIARCLSPHNFNRTVLDGLPHNPTLFYSEVLAGKIVKRIY
jgi:pimeloyl-ACP methyl ester carboxylesterase